MKMFVRLLAVWLALFAGMGVLPSRGAPALEACRAPEELAGATVALPQVAAVLKAGGRLRVLAIGSATMFGPDATLSPGTVTSQGLNNTPLTIGPAKPLAPEATEQAFPRQMAKALQEAYPGLVVEVVLRGGRSFTAAEMLTLMRTDLAAGKFQLVLWQTGTVEAVRNTPPGEFAQVLADGAEAVEAAGANLVLIDPQFSRFLQTSSNLDPYAQALEQTASMAGVALFHRFDLMRAWANDGQIDLERTPRADRRRTVERLHACLGTFLARMVSAGAHS